MSAGSYWFCQLVTKITLFRSILEQLEEPATSENALMWYMRKIHQPDFEDNFWYDIRYVTKKS